VRDRPLVLYHANCADGFCAAWVAHLALGDFADYVPVQYGTPPPDVAGRRVYILDFSYKRPVMDAILAVTDRVVILDHHKTAEAELAGLSCARFDMNKSGGRMAWEFFFPGKPSPWLVDYTEDRDLWRWALPYSQQISAFLASHPVEFQFWDSLNADGPGSERWDSWITQGDAILRYQSQQVERAVVNATEIEMDGHRVLCVNATSLISEVAGRLAEGRPFGAAWFVRGDGKRQWSLRSTKDGIDVSEVARKRGGGGHKHAAGFEE
jgi:oligoribonuclease NrnB/cAMP/cGMP phosphodiesterase (DHH superfamily)